jgi:cell division protein FtsI (penicillin-binding protein 3)
MRRGSPSAKTVGPRTVGPRILEHRRLRLVRFLTLAGFALITLRVVQLQGATGQAYRTLGNEETVVRQVLPAPRGTIYDREGQPLVLSVPVDQVVADPELLPDPAQAAAALAPLVGQSVSALTGVLSERSGYVVLTRDLPAAEAGRVLALDLPGVTLTPREHLVAPIGELAAPVLGGVNGAGVGVSGLEEEYQGLLAGRPGEEEEAVAPSGVVIPGTTKLIRRPRSGTGLELTIDAGLQWVVERDLAAGVAKAQAANGVAIVEDPRTGAILAMASVVRNPTTGAVTPAPQNLALTQVYEPGSVFKLVTFSAALQDGLITPDTVVQVPSVLPIDGAIFHDAWSHPAEPMTASQILAESSNMGTILIAERLGADRLAAQISRLGFGKPTGLGFPGASPGLVKPVATWSPTAIGSTPIGQDTGVTAQQILDLFSTVANGGVAIPPRLVAATVSPSGSFHPVPPAAGHRVIAAWADAELVRMMESVATPIGTAPAAAVPGYTVAGKTGTSQIPDPTTGGYTPGAYWGTFAGFAPAQDPALAAVVVMTRPHPIYGGSVAAPVFSQIMRYALARYGVPSLGAGQPLPPTPQQVGTQG